MNAKNRWFLSGLALVSALATGGAEAAVKCQIREGSGCNGPVIYEMQMCAEITANQHACVRRCEDLKPICNVEDFDRWVHNYSLWGRNGIGGNLLNNSEAIDEDGNLVFTSGQTYTVCKREKYATPGFIPVWIFSSYNGPNAVSQPKVCPRTKVASADSCANGTVFNPVTALCEIQDPSCGSGSSGLMADLIKQGQMFVATQNDHFSTNSKIDPNQFAVTANPNGSLGLQQPTGAGGTANEFAATGGAGSAANRRTRTSGRDTAAGSGSGSGNMGSSGIGAGGGTSGAKDGLSSPEQSMLASTYLGQGEGGGSLGGAGAGANGGRGGSGGSSDSSLSWFGSKGATPGEAGAEVAFSGKDGANGDASRGPASDSDLLKIEDPADYFLKSDIDLSLFKRVTARFRKKEKDLVLAP
jgi:hypothetical protein